MQISAGRGNVVTIDCASKIARSSTAKKPRSIVHAKKFGHSRDDRGIIACKAGMCAVSIDRGFFATDGQAALRAQSIVGLLPWMAEVCAAKSLDDLNPYFAHNIRIYKLTQKTCLKVVLQLLIVE